MLSSAKNWLSTLNRAICSPFTSTRRAGPGQPEIGYLRIHWSANRWDNAMQKPVFAFSVSGEELRARVAGAA
jgi:hypothetical protein